MVTRRLTGLLSAAAVLALGSGALPVTASAEANSVNEDVYYVANGHIYFDNTDACTVYDWGCAPDSGTSPGATYGQSTNLDYVVYFGSNDHVYWVYQDAGGVWHRTDMCATYNWGCSTLQEGAPSTGVDGNGNDYVFFTGSNDHIYEASNSSGSWQSVDMCSQENWGCTASTQPGAGVNPVNGDQFVFYVGSNDQIYEADYRAGSWHKTDQCSQNNWGCSPSEDGGPGVGVADDGTQYVFYTGTNGQIYEADYTGGSWHSLDQCSQNGWGCHTEFEPGAGVNQVSDGQFVNFAGSNGHLYEAYYTSAAWHTLDMCSTFGWGCAVSSAPAVAAR